ncbi:MAG: hypothetical protein MKZ53_04760, partial [Candidatus Thalassarchaeum sp.]|nr:hypothetical protein [Candidatus Thalassarchaeum sp.]
HICSNFGWNGMSDYGRFMGFTHRMGGMIVSRTKATAQKRLARLLRGRIEPHGKEMTDESILKGVEVDESGIVQLWVQPTRAHCPCCINDLMELRSEINQQKGVLACHIEVVGVPQADRWTAAINE